MWCPVRLLIKTGVEVFVIGFILAAGKMLADDDVAVEAVEVVFYVFCGPSLGRDELETKSEESSEVWWWLKICS